MKHFPPLGALALGVMLTTTACSGNRRDPIYDPGSARPSVGERDGRGSARPNKDKDQDGVRCNAGRGNGNGNGRCRNGNRGRG